jgi:hypothetical protein
MELGSGRQLPAARPYAARLCAVFLGPGHVLAKDAVDLGLITPVRGVFLEPSNNVGVQPDCHRSLDGTAALRRVLDRRFGNIHNVDLTVGQRRDLDELVQLCVAHGFPHSSNPILILRVRIGVHDEEKRNRAYDAGSVPAFFAILDPVGQDQMARIAEQGS